MAQMTWRAPEELMDRVRAAAQREGRSMNEYVTWVLAAATDPELAGEEITRVRERLARAGLLAPTGTPRGRPDEAAVARARAAAGRGKSLSEFVREGRG
jgi:uncharacterized protein (DUF1778 family)